MLCYSFFEDNGSLRQRAITRSTIATTLPMKISLKLQDHHHERNHHPPLLLRAKIPITILNLPFLSHFSTTTTRPSDLSLSLSTNFPSFPSLKLSYAAAAAAAAPPLSLTLKSGTGLFGSPNNSPLVISAHFSFNPANPSNPNPTFSLLLKPQLGSFSLRKSTVSHADNVSDPNSFEFVPLERPETMKDLSIGKRGKENDSVFKGIQIRARTEMPVGKKLGLNFRWGVNFSEDQMPILRINKIGLHRVEFDDESKAEQGVKKKNDEGNAGELEILKGMCFWMKKELDVLTSVNREMKCELEEVKAGHFGGGGFKKGIDKKKVMVMPSVGSSSGGFKQWQNTRNREGENGKREEKKGSIGSDVENELQRAIEAANAAAAAST